MGYNLFSEEPLFDKASHSSTLASNQSCKERAEDIFHSHAGGEVLSPGTSFSNACLSLARAYPETVLGALKVPSVQGRVWEVFDENHDGVLDLHEFVKGVENLLTPTTPQSLKLVERMVKGITAQKVDYSGVKRVAIVGGGVAGLQVAHQLSQAGKECVIFEKTPDVGGVWRHNYADFGLQVPKDLYEFPAFPWPADMEQAAGLFPSGQIVQQYIQRFAGEFGLYEMCKLNTAILGLEVGTESCWSVKYQTKGHAPSAEEFDFVVICTGMYGWPPHLPLAQDNKKFKGDILHSCAFNDRKQAAQKKVVVVGAGKPAFDAALCACKEGKSCTLVTREIHEPVPRYLLNMVPFKYGTYSRFGHFMLPTHFEENCGYWWFQSIMAPMKWAWWKVVETMFRVQFQLPSNLAPGSRIDYDLFNGGQILNYESRDMIKKGLLKQIVGSVDYFTENSVVLIDGTELESDMVVYGTGMKKSYDMFDSSFTQPELNIQPDGIYLWRNIIPPQVNNVAFVGSEVSTFNNILTHGLQAMWLKKLLVGELKLPRVGTMQEKLEKEAAWKRSWMPPTQNRAATWQLHMMKYHDNLCRDMGVAHKRKCNPFSEVLMPYTARDYAGLFAEGGDAPIGRLRRWLHGLITLATWLVVIVAVTLRLLYMHGFI